MRSVMGVALLAGMPLVQAVAQDAPTPVSGQRVRITVPAVGLKKQVATVERLEPDALVVMTDTALRVPLTDVTRLDRSLGRRSYGGRGALVGLASGTLLGGMAFYAWGCIEGPHCPFQSHEGGSHEGDVAVAYFALGGAVLGTVTGYVIGTSVHGDRWERVPVEGLRVTIAPRSRGAAIGVALAL